MDCCFQALNSKGFSSCLESGRIPEPDHITYGGAFNQVNFTIGAKAKEPLELFVGYARSQNKDSQFDNEINNYLGIFTKGSKDGEDRDNRRLNAVIVLDISGSMSSGLTSQGQGCRIQLAKQAIKMFYSKLRPNDCFGLITFNTAAQVIIKICKKSQTTADAIFNVVDSIKPNGGTTLMSGFNEANKLLMQCINSQEFVKNECETRIIMLTDVGDNSFSNASKFIQEVEQSGIHTTIIGISDDFVSSTCQKLNQVKGFNYFCATEVEDLKKYLFQNFSYTFFPANYNIQIGLQSDNINSIQVFGTVDAEKVSFYNNNFKQKSNKLVVTRTKTSFPSDLQMNLNGQVKTFGGLILVKLNLRSPQDKFQAKIHLQYETIQSQKKQNNYNFIYEIPQNKQFVSHSSLTQAMNIFHYVYEVKNILNVLKQSPGKKQSNKFALSLQKLKKTVPESKLKELEDMIKVLKQQSIFQ